MDEQHYNKIIGLLSEPCDWTRYRNTESFKLGTRLLVERIRNLEQRIENLENNPKLKPKVKKEKK